MKKLVSMVCAIVFLFSCAAQTSIAVSTDKTTSLIFPFAVLHVDRGTRNVLVQPVKESNNILLVKAAVKDFPETNLSVVTQDGSMYAFTIRYDTAQASYIYNISPQSKEALSTYANAILVNPPTMHGIRSCKWNMLARVTGIYVKDDVMYYQLEINNQSSLNYDIDVLRFFIRDKKKGKRTASQENELNPLYVAGNISQVKAKTKNVIVVALDKFTIPDGKYLGIQCMEKNGGRHLFLRVNNGKIFKAISLPDLK